jgi:hypothetical protein
MATDTVKTERKSQLKRSGIELLGAPDFFHCLLDAVRRGGLVGEKRNALALYIVGLSALLDRPLNAIVKGTSSSGKNYLVTRVLRLLPESAVREITSSSKTAWNYGEQDFCHRVVYLQERNDAAGAIHPVRLLISEGRLVRIVTANKGGVLVTKTHVAEGPIASISTTTRDRIEIDDETRHVSLWVDESEEQTRQVIDQYLVRESPLTDDELKTWHDAYDLIAGRARARTPITIPDWFPIMAKQVYDGSVTVRRYFPAFVEACRTICLIRSFERGRKQSKDSKLELEFADFAIAALIFDGVFVQSLQRHEGSALETRKAVKVVSDSRDGKPVQAEDLTEEFGISLDRTYRRLREAAQAGTIRQVNAPEKDNRKFFLPAPPPRFIPDPRKLFPELKGVGGTVRFVHPITGEWVTYSRRKPAG